MAYLEGIHKMQCRGIFIDLQFGLVAIIHCCIILFQFWRTCHVLTLIFAKVSLLCLIKMDLQVGVDVIHCERGLQPQIQKHRAVVMAFFPRRTKIMRYKRTHWICLTREENHTETITGLFSFTAEKLFGVTKPNCWTRYSWSSAVHSYNLSFVSFMAIIFCIVYELKTFI